MAEVLCRPKFATPTARGLFRLNTNRSQIVYAISTLFLMVRSINPEDRISRIRELCTRAANTKDPDEEKEITSQLRVELRAQIAWLRELGATHHSRAASDDESNESKCA